MTTTTKTKRSTLGVHRYQATNGEVPVNAYLVEGTSGVVAVDATLTVSDGKALRALADRLGKPLLGVVITHPHPDHYGGLVELVRDLDVPTFATAGVIDVARRDDIIKEEILRPMFGDEWAAERAFPDTAVADGDTIELRDIALTVTDLGPGESPHDTVWTLEDEQTLFSADLAYNRMHCYLADGYHTEWIANIDRLLRKLPPHLSLRPGHGEACGLGALGWQRGYLETVLDAMRAADWTRPEQAKAEVLDKAHAYLPAHDLDFLLALSIDPLADKLGVQ
jgi:glyoxylase-like metal-dependent hydrolase (beta-lactamase superfamily II)